MAVKYTAKLKATISLQLRQNIAFIFLYKVHQVVGRKVCVLRFAAVTVCATVMDHQHIVLESETSGASHVLVYVINTTNGTTRTSSEPNAVANSDDTGVLSILRSDLFTIL